MSEYEMADLFLNYAELLQSIVERFIALLFAFLIAAYLVSAKLQKPIVLIVLVLYSYMALQYAFFYFNVALDQVALAHQLSEVRAQPDSNLGWLEVSGTALGRLYYSQTTAMVLGYLASVAFFFYTRRHPRRSTSTA